MEIEESGRTTRRSRLNVWWMTLVVVSTAATAYILSIFGLIPVNPVYAVIMGSIFGMLYVFYQIFYFREMSKRVSPHLQEPDDDFL